MGTPTAALNTSTPLSGTFEADPVHSSFGFSVRYQGVSIFRGSLTEVEARLRHGRLEGTAKVDSISIRTPEQFRAHVLSSEFFDVANHPEVKFVSTALAIDSTGAASVTGDLTIKGITGPSRRPAGGPHRQPTRSATPVPISSSRQSSTAPSGT
jgi:polyisoprenoid-binding protein YceI